MDIPAPYDGYGGKRTIVEAMRELHEFRLAWFEYHGYPDMSIIRRATYGTPVEQVELPEKRKSKREIE